MRLGPLNELGRRPMRRKRWIAGVAGPLTVALAVAGCGSGSDGSGNSSNSGGADQQKKNDTTEISLHSTEPQNPLVPGNTNEEGGAKVIDELFTGLVKYDPVTNEPKNANAEKVDLAPDGMSVTFTLKKGWKFHDGTDVTAKSYVDAWNYTAYGPNGQLNAAFFTQIKGFADVNPPDPDGDGPQKAPEPKAKTMSGLEAPDPLTLKVSFSSPHAIFPIKVGYHAFSPLPEAFFKDPKAFEAKPIGDGPYMFVSRVPKQEIKLTRFDGYGGDDKAKIKDIKYVFPESLDASYAALKSGQLDFLEQVPPSAIAGNIWKQDLGDKSGTGDVLAIQVMSFPLYDPKYQNPDLRKAISMAINRDEITQKIFEGLRHPVDGYAVPKTPGWSDGECADFCKYNPQKAKDLFAKTGFKGPLEITSNADGGHKEWIEAVCGNIKNTLGIDCNFVPVQTFSEVRKKITAHTMTQMYRAGWIADYPDIENFLNPLYRTGGSSNDGLYSSPAVDAKLAAADKATSIDEAHKLYSEAEGLIAQDMPAIPLWSTPRNYGWSNRLKNVRMTPQGQIDLSFVDVA
jgi:oligopeptide transport system substrate-binding protein